MQKKGRNTGDLRRCGSGAGYTASVTAPEDRRFFVRADNCYVL